MKISKATSVEDYKIVSSFQSLRKTLLDDRYADRLEKPLAYWALPNDRRLPLAFLGRTIKDLLATPFEELSATPGIGQKKISSLVKLLSRATKDEPPVVPFGLAELTEEPAPAAAPETGAPLSAFDPTIVSEALWSQWQQTVVEHGAGHEPLGRVAPTLRALPTVIWHTPLAHYLNHTLAEIRQLKTHGEKRVRAVLEVFCLMHEMLSGKSTKTHLTLRVVPKFIAPVEQWIGDVLSRPGVPTPAEVRQHLTVPLLEQIRVDAGDQIYDLSASRLGVGSTPQSVRDQSRKMGVTRARVYQLLEECARVMEVRWPEGLGAMTKLAAKFDAEATTHDDTRLFRATFELFFPDKASLAEEEANAAVQAS